MKGEGNSSSSETGNARCCMSPATFDHHWLVLVVELLLPSSEGRRAAERSLSIDCEAVRLLVVRMSGFVLPSGVRPSQHPRGGLREVGRLIPLAILS